MINQWSCAVYEQVNDIIKHKLRKKNDIKTKTWSKKSDKITSAVKLIHIINWSGACIILFWKMKEIIWQNFKIHHTSYIFIMVYTLV